VLTPGKAACHALVKSSLQQEVFMFNRSSTLVLVLGLCAAAGLSAQAATQGQTQAPAQPQQAAPAAQQALAEGRFISFDIGMTCGVPFNGGVEVGRYLAVTFNVTRTLSAGIADIMSGAAQYTTFRLSYFFLPSLGATVYIGSDGNPAGGVGVFYDVLGSRADNGLSTALKLRLDYLVDSTGFQNGRLVLGVVSSIGL
jgi:hypothetical protein